MTSLLTAEQVAAMLQVPKSWVYRAAREGLLPSVPCGRYRRFHPGDVNRWINDQRAASTIGDQQQAPPHRVNGRGHGPGDTAP